MRFPPRVWRDRRAGCALPVVAARTSEFRTAVRNSNTHCRARGLARPAGGDPHLGTFIASSTVVALSATIVRPPSGGPAPGEKVASSDYQVSLGDLIAEARMIKIRAGGADQSIALAMLARLAALVEQALDLLGDLRRDTAEVAAHASSVAAFKTLNELGDLCFLVSAELKASRGNFDRLSNETSHLGICSFLEQTEAKFVRGLCAVSDLARVTGCRRRHGTSARVGSSGSDVSPGFFGAAPSPRHSW